MGEYGVTPATVPHDTRILHDSDSPSPSRQGSRVTREPRSTCEGLKGLRLSAAAGLGWA